MSLLPLSEFVQQPHTEIVAHALEYAADKKFMSLVMPLLLQNPDYSLLFKISQKIPQKTIFFKVMEMSIAKTLDFNAFGNFSPMIAASDLKQLMEDRVLEEDTNSFVYLKREIIHNYQQNKQKTVFLIEKLLKKKSNLKFNVIYQLLRREIYVDVLVRELISIASKVATMPQETTLQSLKHSNLKRQLTRIFLLLLKLKRLESYHERIYAYLLIWKTKKEVIRDYARRSIRIDGSAINLETIPPDVISEVIMDTLFHLDPAVLEKSIITFMEDQQMNLEPQIEEQIVEETVVEDIDVDAILNKTVEITEDEQKEIITSCIDRILKLNEYLHDEATISKIDNTSVLATRFGWILIVSRIMTRGLADYKQQFLAFVLQSITKRIDLLVYWLFEEYYNQYILEIPTNEGYEFWVESVMEAMRNGIDEVPKLEPGNRLFTKFLIEIPFIPLKGMERVYSYCNDPEYYPLGLTTLRDLAIHRPAVRSEMIDKLLEFSCTIDTKSRGIAVMHLKKLMNGRDKLASQIYQHAETQLHELFDMVEPVEELQVQQFSKVIYSKLDLYLSLCLDKPELIKRIYSDATKFNTKVRECVRAALKATAQEMATEKSSVEVLFTIEKSDSQFMLDLYSILLTEDFERTQEQILRLWENEECPLVCLNLILDRIPAEDTLKFLQRICEGFATENETATREALLILAKGEKEALVALMIALHRLADKMESKNAEKATSVLLSSESYTAEILSIVIKKLTTEPVLSFLFARTVYLSCVAHSELVPSCNGVLAPLIGKLWRQKVLRFDFCQYCIKFFPNTIDLLASLPPKMMEEVVDTQKEFVKELQTWFSDNRGVSSTRYNRLRNFVKSK